MKSFNDSAATDLMSGWQLLRAAGYDAADFTLEEDGDSELGDLLGLGGGILTVRHQPSGVERIYATGPETNWRSALAQDALQGTFGPRRSMAGATSTTSS